MHAKLVAGIVGVVLTEKCIAHLYRRCVNRSRIIEISLASGVLPAPPSGLAAKLSLGKSPLTLQDVINVFEGAMNDGRVDGVLIKLGGQGIGLAMIQELRDAIKRFRAKGKWAIAYSDGIGSEDGPATSLYYLATACDHIYIQPVGILSLVGALGQAEFFRGTLDKLGIEAKVECRKEFKNYKNIFTESQYTPAHKEATTHLITVLFNQIVEGIAAERAMTVDEVRDLLDKGPYLAQEAANAKLIDGVLHPDEVYDLAKTKAARGRWFIEPVIVAARTYLKHNQIKGGRRCIGLIYANGPIVRGKSQGFASGDSTAGDTLAAALREAAKDKATKAIVVRIDSPGGAVSASETIWREMVRAKEKKPVIVSMGNVAASGGYYMSTHATKILAMPGTITGSIGVFAGKFLVKGLYHKLGVTLDDVSIGKSAKIFSPFHDFDEHGKERLNQSLDVIYDRFTTLVAEGRKLSKEAALELAKGRVWTGEDALKLGLIDKFGGLYDAIKTAKEEAGIDGSAQVKITEFGANQGFWASILASKEEKPEHEASFAEESTLLNVVKRLADLELFVGELQGDALRAPSLQLQI